MAPLVEPTVCRFTVNGTFGGRNIANIFDMTITGETPGFDRTTAINHQAQDMVAAWKNRILPLVANDYTFTSVSFVDLNTLDGITGAQTTGPSTVLPLNGASTEDPLPPNVAALVTKVAPGGGRATRNGRTYVVGLRETQTDPGNPTRLTSAAQGFLTAALEGFSSDISNGPLDAGYDSNMVVLHTRNIADPGDPPNIVAVGYSPVTAMTCDIVLATQRRRLRGR